MAKMKLPRRLKRRGIGLRRAQRVSRLAGRSIERGVLSMSEYTITPIEFRGVMFAELPPGFSHTFRPEGFPELDGEIMAYEPLTDVFLVKLDRPTDPDQPYIVATHEFVEATDKSPKMPKSPMWANAMIEFTNTFAGGDE